MSMRFVFKNIGKHKFTKVIDVVSLDGFTDVLEFIVAEADPHLPEEGDVELVPIDDRAPLLSNCYVIVHHDKHHVSRGMGTVSVLSA